MIKSVEIGSCIEVKGHVRAFWLSTGNLASISTAFLLLPYFFKWLGRKMGGKKCNLVAKKLFLWTYHMYHVEALISHFRRGYLSKPVFVKHWLHPTVKYQKAFSMKYKALEQDFHPQLCLFYGTFLPTTKPLCYKESGSLRNASLQV